jgi:hypothetical protein
MDNVQKNSNSECYTPSSEPSESSSRHNAQWIQSSPLTEIRILRSVCIGYKAD